MVCGPRGGDRVRAVRVAQWSPASELVSLLSFHTLALPEKPEFYTQIGFCLRVGVGLVLSLQNSASYSLEVKVKK